MGIKQAVDGRIMRSMKAIAPQMLDVRSQQVQQSAPVQGNIGAYAGGINAPVTMNDGSPVNAFVGSRPVREGDAVIVFGGRIFA